MTYKKANVSRKCKETYKKRRTSPRRKSPRRKRRMNSRGPIDNRSKTELYEDSADMVDAFFKVQDANNDLNLELVDERSKNASQEELDRITKAGMEKIARAKEEFSFKAEEYNNPVRKTRTMENIRGQTRSGRNARSTWF